MGPCRYMPRSPPGSDIFVIYIPPAAAGPLFGSSPLSKNSMVTPEAAFAHLQPVVPLPGRGYLVLRTGACGFQLAFIIQGI